MFATIAPIAPRPTTPRVFPFISQPPKFDLFFSTSAGTLLPSSLILCVHAIPLAISLEERNRLASTSSFTAFAFAPGVLNTMIPWSLHLSIGILLVPAPALAMALRFVSSSISCILKLLTTTASGLKISLATS